VFELSKPSKLTDLQTAVLRLPAIVGGVTDAMLATDLADRLPRLDEFEDADDLLLAELTLAHDVPPVRVVHAGVSHNRRSWFQVSGQIELRNEGKRIARLHRPEKS